MRFVFAVFCVLQVCVFQIGEGQGVVCYDREKNEVYFAQHFDEALLQSQIHGFRFISGSERSVQLYFFLTASLVYAEVDGQVSLSPHVLADRLLRTVCKPSSSLPNP